MTQPKIDVPGGTVFPTICLPAQGPLKGVSSQADMTS